MASKVTVTGKIGAGNSVTSLAISNVVDVEVDHSQVAAGPVLRVKDKSGNITYWDISSATTFTCTISGTDFTYTIS